MNRLVRKAYLCDFGMTRIHHPKEPNSTSLEPHASMKVEFAAPELTGTNLRPEAPGDVYSLAKCILAFAECKEPAEGPIPKSPGQGLVNACGAYTSDMWDLMRKLTRVEPGERPIMTESSIWNLKKGVHAQLLAIMEKA